MWSTRTAGQPRLSRPEKQPTQQCPENLPSRGRCHRQPLGRYLSPEQRPRQAFRRQPPVRILRRSCKPPKRARWKQGNQLPGGLPGEPRSTSVAALSPRDRLSCPHQASREQTANRSCSRQVTQGLARLHHVSQLLLNSWTLAQRTRYRHSVASTAATYIRVSRRKISRTSWHTTSPHPDPRRRCRPPRPPQPRTRICPPSRHGRSYPRIRPSTWSRPIRRRRPTLR